jgi:hypothetical protein
MTPQTFVFIFSVLIRVIYAKIILKKGGYTMKKELFWITLLIMAIISGCAARVNLGLDQNGNIKFDRAGGYSSPERGLRIKLKQEETKTLLLVEEHLQEAIETNEDGDIDKWLTRKEKVANATVAVKVRVAVKISNPTPWTGEIKSGEFAGLIIMPGETTVETRKVPVGKYSFLIKNHKTGKIREITRYITKETRVIILKKKTY